MPDSWSPSPASERRGGAPLDQRLDRWMSAGRQLVDGVSGARPGRRGEGRRPGLDGLGRWVENKLDWILEDDDDWREPWQEPRPQPSAPLPSRRRPLDAISRRTNSGRTPSRRTTVASQPGPSQADDPTEWPDDDTFTVPRWQRQAVSGQSASSGLSSDSGPVAGDGLPPLPGRVLPRSTRRR